MNFMDQGLDGSKFDVLQYSRTLDTIFDNYSGFSSSILLYLMDELFYA